MRLADPIDAPARARRLTPLALGCTMKLQTPIARRLIRTPPRFTPASSIVAGID